MPIPCDKEDLLREMHGDVKVLVKEFQKMNGELVDMRTGFEGHKKESIGYRRKVDMLWAGTHFSKWVIGLMLGTGLLFNVIRYFQR